MVLILPFSSTYLNECQTGVGRAYQIILDRVMHVLHLIVFKFGIKNFTIYYMIINLC